MTTARDITLKLGGTWHGTYGSCRCPVHNDRSPSLSIKDGATGAVLLVYCHAGCDWRTIKDELVRRGLIEHSPRCAAGRSPARSVTKVTRGPDPIPKWGRGELAHRIWHSAQEVPGTLAEVYLRARALTLPPPATLRFQRIKHIGSSKYVPAMIALVEHSSFGPVGIHRTFLREDGGGKADVDPARMALGPISGGAVRLAPAAPGAALLVGEGIETVLSGMQATGRSGWATLGTSGLRNLDLPADVRDVTILADADDAGEAAAQFVARRWQREGRRVRIARPPNGHKDFNDALMTEQAQ